MLQRPTLEAGRLDAKEEEEAVAMEPQRPLPLPREHDWGGCPTLAPRRALARGALPEEEVCSLYDGFVQLGGCKSPCAR